MDDHQLTQTDIAELTGMQKQNVHAYLKNKGLSRVKPEKYWGRDSK